MRKHLDTQEVLRWLENDWLGLWELADEGGLDAGVPLDDVREFVVRSVEPGLRAGLIMLGRVYTSPTGTFEAITLSIRDQLDLIREGVTKDKVPIDIDLWFDGAPDVEATRRKPGIS